MGRPSIATTIGFLHASFVPSSRCRSPSPPVPASARVLVLLWAFFVQRHGARCMVRPSPPGYGYGYVVGSAVDAPSMSRQQPPGPDGVTGGVLKRSLSEMERWQQALYFRAVRQRTAALAQPAHQQLDIGAVLGRPPSTGFAGLSPQPSSTLSSSLTTASRVAPPPPMPMQHLLQRQVMATPSTQAVTRGPAATARPEPDTARELVLLKELEKQLLGDDGEEEAEAAGSACGSAVTNSGRGHTPVQQQVNSITVPQFPSHTKPTATMNYNTNTVPTSRSPSSNSTSSTTSSTASSSPPTPAASSRQLLSDAAAAVADGNHTAAAAHLAALKISGNPRGDAEQRLVAMMASALSSRVGPPPPLPPSSHQHDLLGVEQRAAWQLLHDVSPCFGLALHGANLAILDAVSAAAIHVVDFDVSVAQHIALIQALAARRASATPPSLKVTAVVDPTSPFTPAIANALAATAERLARHAQQAGVEFKFRAVSCRAEEIDASRLGCHPAVEETLAVNLAFALSHIPDESVSPANPRDALLRRVRALGPRVVTLVEQELNTNTAPLASRVADACAHYGAVLESLDATLGRDSAHRARAEAALASKVANAVAREGAGRVERCEVFGKWRARFGMAGLRPVPIGESVAERVKARLGPARPGFDVKLDNGRLGVGWMGRVVTVASAWR